MVRFKKRTNEIVPLKHKVLNKQAGLQINKQNKQIPNLPLAPARTKRYIIPE